MDSRTISETQTFSGFDVKPQNEAKDIMFRVFDALSEKGYNPVNQIVGYILSGDPTYVTSFKNARSLICKLERDELLEEIIAFYLQNAAEE